MLCKISCITQVLTYGACKYFFYNRQAILFINDDALDALDQMAHNQDEATRIGSY